VDSEAEIERDILESARKSCHSGVSSHCTITAAVLKTVVPAIANLQSLDRNLGIVLLDRGRRVVWANSVQWRNFPEIKAGMLCYECYNLGFKSPCRWCGFDECLKPGSGAVMSQAVSPESMTVAEASPVYSDLIHIPICESPSAEPVFVLELVKVVTYREVERAKRDRGAAAALGDLARALLDAGINDVYDFILLGSFLYLRPLITNAHLEIFEPTGKAIALRSLSCADATGLRVHSLLEHISTAQAEMQRKGPSRATTGAIHSHIRNLITTAEPVGTWWSDCIQITPQSELSSLKQSGEPSRTRSAVSPLRTAVCYIDDSMTSRDCLLHIDVGRESDFLSERDLTDLYLYCGFIGRMLQFRAQNDNRLAKIVRLLPNEQHLYLGSTVIQLWALGVLINAHEIMSCRDRLVNSLSSIPTFKSGLPKWAEDAIAGAKDALDHFKSASQNIQDAEDGAAPLDFASRDVVAFVQRVTEPFRSEMQSRGVLFELRTPKNNKGHPETIMVNWDCKKMRVVLANLFTNALRALSLVNKVNKRITISMSIPRDSVVEIAVSDTGPGFDSSYDRSKFFEPFFTTRTIQGIGLGLTIVKLIVESHHGNVWIENTSDGAVVKLHLPVDPTTVSSSTEL
jgi:anti-sigma regulatory factor (Ser/Thr protein kinase)